MFGCGDIAHAMTRAGLIDEFGMWVHPVSSGGATGASSTTRATQRLWTS